MRLKAGDEIKLKTKVIKDGNPYEVKGHIYRSISGKEFFARLLRVNETSKQLGWIQYEIKENCVFVHYRKNESEYKGVGSALGEFVFLVSMLAGKGGALENCADFTAHPFHYNWGMRFTAEENSRYAADHDGKTLDEYLAELLKLAKNGERLNTEELGNCAMYLPHEMIVLKKPEYGIETADDVEARCVIKKPVNSNLFWHSGNLCVGNINFGSHGSVIFAQGKHATDILSVFS